MWLKTISSDNIKRLSLNLQILRQLLSSLVCRVHGEEDSELQVHFDGVAVSEDESSPFLFLTRQHNRNLESIYFHLQ